MSNRIQFGLGLAKRSLPRCQCCQKNTTERGIKSCETCEQGGCKEGYARFWKRSEVCPMRVRNKRNSMQRHSDVAGE